MPGNRRRILDPTERVSEVLFGVIMVLTFTGSMSVAEAGREEIRTMLVGAIGCNMAWGIVDAVMYVLTSLINRQRDLVAAVPTATHGGPTALPSGAPGGRASLTRQDLEGAVATFLLVFLCTFPVVVPFLIFRANAVRALRVSNAVALAMLFVGGYSLGRHSGLSPWKLGLSMIAVGTVLVAITVALGG